VSSVLYCQLCRTVHIISKLLFLCWVMISDTLVEGFTFVTFPLTSQPNIYQSRFGDLPGVARSRTRVYGVEQHYLQVFACYRIPTAQHLNRSYPLRWCITSTTCCPIMIGQCPIARSR